MSPTGAIVFADVIIPTALNMIREGETCRLEIIKVFSEIKQSNLIADHFVGSQGRDKTILYNT